MSNLLLMLLCDVCCIQYCNILVISTLYMIYLYNTSVCLLYNYHNSVICCMLYSLLEHTSQPSNLLHIDLLMSTNLSGLHTFLMWFFRQGWEIAPTMESNMMSVCLNVCSPVSKKSCYQKNSSFLFYRLGGTLLK